MATWDEIAAFFEARAVVSARGPKWLVATMHTPQFRLEIGEGVEGPGSVVRLAIRLCPRPYLGPARALALSHGLRFGAIVLAGDVYELRGALPLHATTLVELEASLQYLVTVVRALRPTILPSPKNTAGCFDNYAG